jgi:TolB protein
MMDGTSEALCRRAGTVDRARVSPRSVMAISASLLLALPLLPRPVAAQDTSHVEGVRVGITYTPGVRPGLLLLGGPHDERLDSARAIIARDLDYSDRFEIITLPGSDSLALGLASLSGGAPRGGSAAASGGGPFVNYALYDALGADYTVSVVQAPDSGVNAMVYDVKGRGLRQTISLPNVRSSDAGFRMAVHRASDEIVRVAAGTPGIAATQILFALDKHIYRVDADGANVVSVATAGARMLSPAWAPDGQHIVYSELGGGLGRLYVQDLVTGKRELIAPAPGLESYAATFSPDGKTLVFSGSGSEGTHLYSYNLAAHCCLQRLTAGRFSDNLSPTFSPDGRRIAFVSTRAGGPQIYVMSADGTDQELFAPFDYGVTGSSYAPDWSPDGLHIAFHRDVAGAYQVFVMDVASRTVRQLTSEGSNEDPTWAPDGRHLAFASTRTGARQIWVMDLDTGRVRQLTRQQGARLPSWSRRLADTTNH